jgi:hypothetical protein
MDTCNMKTVRTHDFVVGMLYLASLGGVFMGYSAMMYVGFAVAALQIASPLTKFCPVYLLLNKGSN